MSDTTPTLQAIETALSAQEQQLADDRRRQQRIFELRQQRQEIVRQQQADILDALRVDEYELAEAAVREATEQFQDAVTGLLPQLTALFDAYQQRDAVARRINAIATEHGLPGVASPAAHLHEGFGYARLLEAAIQLTEAGRLDVYGRRDIERLREAAAVGFIEIRTDREQHLLRAWVRQCASNGAACIVVWTKSAPSVSLGVPESAAGKTKKATKLIAAAAPVAEPRMLNGELIVCLHTRYAALQVATALADVFA